MDGKDESPIQGRSASCPSEKKRWNFESGQKNSSRYHGKDQPRSKVLSLRDTPPVERKSKRPVIILCPWGPAWCSFDLRKTPRGQTVAKLFRRRIIAFLQGVQVDFCFKQPTAKNHILINTKKVLFGQTGTLGNYKLVTFFIFPWGTRPSFLAAASGPMQKWPKPTGFGIFLGPGRKMPQAASVLSLPFLSAKIERMLFRDHWKPFRKFRSQSIVQSVTQKHLLQSLFWKCNTF